MFTDGYEVELVKLWGRWASSTFRSYIWRDHYAMSSVERGMLGIFPIQSLER